MKAVIFILACLLGAIFAAPLTSNQYEFLFVQFLNQYNKQYETNDVFSRFKTFRANVDLILAHNAQNLSWKMSVNEFADLTHAEFQSLMGLRGDRHLSYAQSQNVAAYNPSFKAGPIDWREKGVVNAVKNQAQCGSCWAFSATTVVESAVAIKTGTLHVLAEQQMVDCDTNSSGCNGGLMSFAFEYLIKAGGQCLESDYHYTARDGSCKDSSCKKVAQITGYKSIATNDAAHLDALQKGPIAVAIAASSSAFQFYSSGVLTVCSDRQINHGVALVGYGSENGLDYYILRNSWGSGSWGEQGYMRIQAGKSLCGLTTSSFDVYPVA